MVAIYRLTERVDFRSLTASRADIAVLVDIKAFLGDSLRDTWHTPRLFFRDVYEEFDRRDLSMIDGDFPSFLSGSLVVSDRAIERLGDLITDAGELLPIADLPSYHLVNITRFVDVLDRERTRGSKLAPDRNVAIRKYMFKPGLGDIGLFRIPEDPTERLATDAFVNAVADMGLEGLEFERLGESVDSPAEEA